MSSNFDQSDGLEAFKHNEAARAKAAAIEPQELIVKAPTILYESFKIDTRADQQRLAIEARLGIVRKIEVPVADSGPLPEEASITTVKRKRGQLRKVTAAPEPDLITSEPEAVAKPAEIEAGPGTVSPVAPSTDETTIKLIDPALVVKPQPDLDEIQRAFNIIAQGRTVEMRALNTANGTVSGYYNEAPAFAKDAFDESAAETTPAVYWTIQCIDPLAIGTKEPNVCRGHVVNTTRDDQVLRYSWLPIDFDPKRDANSNSTDLEKAEAHRVASEVRGYLTERGITSVFADSGNGYHLLVKVDFEVTKKDLVKSLLNNLSRKFSTADTSIDRSLLNPSRILKAYGTVARKGPHTIERPWRTARILDAAGIQMTSEESLRKLDAEIRSEPRLGLASAASSPAPTTSAKNIDIDISMPLYKRLLDGEHIPNGAHDNTIQSYSGYLRETMRMETWEEIFDDIISHSDQFDNPGDDFSQMCERHAKNICDKPVGRDCTILIGGKVMGTTANAPSLPVTPVQASTGPGSTPPQVGFEILQFTMTEAEQEIENENEYPILPLVTPVGPEWNDSILYGRVGEIIKKASAFNESHPAGMYLNLLVGLGSIIGPNPYFVVNETKHHTNETLACVGATSTSRKGTGRDAVNKILQGVDMWWYENRIKGGFGSGQSIVNEIRDDRVSSVYDKKSKAFVDVLKPGIADKRLYIEESELAAVFNQAAQSESTADVIIRNGWDSKPLKNTVKGATEGVSNSCQCQHPHLTISGDTTVDELCRTMPTGADKNGFGNRPLYCYVYRTKICSAGGPPIDWTDDIMYLQAAVADAKNIDRVDLTKAAWTLWKRMYPKMETEQLNGMAGDMTRRGAAHIRRLALILCLIDRKDVVEVVHLHAAKAIWDYCAESALLIFNKFTKDQLKIMNFIQSTPSESGITASQVSEDLFKQNKKVAWIKEQLNALVKTGNIRPEKDGSFKFSHW